MLRELRSCVTLLRELRIVNQSYAQWPSDSDPEFPTKLRKMRILSLTCTIGSSIMFNMNRLIKEQQIRVVAALVEGNSLRSTSRMTGVARNTVTTLLLDLAEGCAGYHDRHVRNLKVRRLQCDEIWNFVGAKAKNTTPEKKAEGWGDTWTWTAVDADTKLCVSYLVGGRDLGWATEFMLDCAHRISNRVQITTDGHRAYMEAVETAFGADIDYAAATEDLRCTSREPHALFSSTVHRLRYEGCERESRSQACLHQFRGAPESFDADEHSPFHSPNERSL